MSENVLSVFILFSLTLMGASGSGKAVRRAALEVGPDLTAIIEQFSARAVILPSRKLPSGCIKTSTKQLIQQFPSATAVHPIQDKARILAEGYPEMRLYKFHPRAEDHRVKERAKEKASPWKLGGLTPWQLSKRVYHEIDEDEVFTRSAALSFYFVAALVPMLFFLMTLLGMFGRSHDLESSLFTYVGRFLPGDAYTLLQKTLKEITTNSTGLKLVGGLLLALWSGSGGMRSIMDALNRCYHLKESRPYWKQVLISVVMTVVIAALTIAALVIVLYGGAIAQFVGNHLNLSDVTVLAWKVVQWPIALFFVVLSFAIMYYWLPDAEQDWAWITPGSLIGVLLWIGASVGFRVYLSFSNSYSKTYGSLGAVIILLYWLFITGMAILIGGEINSEIEHAAAERGHPEAKGEGEKVA